MSAANQSRSDARTAYFDPARYRPNLHVAAKQTVTRLVLGRVGANARLVPVDGDGWNASSAGPTRAVKAIEVYALSFSLRPRNSSADRSSCM